MRAAVMNTAHSLKIEDRSTPEIGPSDVLVRVGAAGICAGDLYIYQGKNPYAIYPVIGGHEIAGVVEKVGADVVGWKPGDRVVVEPFLGCGACYPCRENKPNCCANLRIIGVHRDGGFADYVSAPGDHIHRVPDGLDLVKASLAEPVAIAIQACRRGQVKAGEYVLVLGCGPIGLALIEVLRALKARVVAADIDPGRLQIASKLGAQTIVSGPDMLNTVLSHTNGEGAPVVIEATGKGPAIEQTIDLVAAGGRIVILGLMPRGAGVTIPGLDITRKEMTILGSRASAHCFPEALQLLSVGAIRYVDYMTELSLPNAPSVFAQLYENPASMHKGIFVF